MRQRGKGKHMELITKAPKGTKDIIPGESENGRSSKT